MESDWALILAALTVASLGCDLPVAPMALLRVEKLVELTVVSSVKKRWVVQKAEWMVLRLVATKGSERDASAAARLE